jgi:hypothetical protein
MYVCMYVYIYIYIYTHTHTHTHTHKYNSKFHIEHLSHVRNWPVVWTCGLTPRITNFTAMSDIFAMFSEISCDLTEYIILIECLTVQIALGKSFVWCYIKVLTQLIKLGYMPIIYELCCNYSQVSEPQPSRIILAMWSYTENDRVLYK